MTTAFCTNDQILSLFGGGLRLNSNDPLAKTESITQLAEEQADEKIRPLFKSFGAEEPYNQNAQVLASWLNAKAGVLDLAITYSERVDFSLYGFYKSIKAFQGKEFEIVDLGGLGVIINPCAYGRDPDGFEVLIPGENCSLAQINRYVDGWDYTDDRSYPLSTSAEEWKLAITTIVYGLGINQGYLIPSSTITLNRKQANIYTRLINEWTACIILQARIYAGRQLNDSATYERCKSVVNLIEAFLLDKHQDTLLGEYFGSTACSCSGGSSGGGSSIEVQAFTGVFDADGRFSFTGHDFNTLEGRSFGYIGRPNDGNSTLYLEINSSTSATLGNMGDGANANCHVYVNIF